MIEVLALALLVGPAEELRDAAVETPASVAAEDTPTPEAAESPEAAEPAEAEPAEAEARHEDAGAAEPVDDGADTDAIAHDEPTDPAPAASATETRLRVSSGSGHDGPPYYTEADMKALRARYEIAEPGTEPPRKARWRCLIADPTCGINFEINATAAYAYRVRQGDVRTTNLAKWHSGRAQYDFWLNFPVLVETEGRQRFTRITFGPKGGVIFSDTGDLWGNLGMAFRYWLGRGRWAPTVEVTSALSYKIGSRPTRNLGEQEPTFRMTRGPVGFTADVGFGLGGFGAIVVGGQYDSPLAREDLLSDALRVSASGMFFLGFRGNIVWGGPAAAGVLTHGLTQRYARAP